MEQSQSLSHQRLKRITLSSFGTSNKTFFSYNPQSPKMLENIIQIITQKPFNDRNLSNNILQILKYVPSITTISIKNHILHPELTHELSSHPLKNIIVQFIDHVNRDQISILNHKIKQISVDSSFFHHVYLHKQVARNLTNVLKINLRIFNYEKESMVNMMVKQLRIFPLLRQVSFMNFTLGSSEFRSLFKNLRDLESISLQYCTIRDVKEDCFSGVSQKFKHISIEFNENVRAQTIQLMELATKQNIKVLVQFKYSQETQQLIEKMFELPIYLNSIYEEPKLLPFMLQHTRGNLETLKYTSLFPIINPMVLIDLAHLQKQIKTLQLSSCGKLRDVSMLIISKLENLENLCLNRCGLTQKGMTYLRRLKRLESLNISLNMVSGKCLQWVYVNLRKVWRVVVERKNFEKSFKGRKVMQNLGLLTCLIA